MSFLAYCSNPISLGSVGFQAGTGVGLPSSSQRYKDNHTVGSLGDLLAARVAAPDIDGKVYTGCTRVDDFGAHLDQRADEDRLVEADATHIDCDTIVPLQPVAQAYAAWSIHFITMPPCTLPPKLTSVGSARKRRVTSRSGSSIHFLT